MLQLVPVLLGCLDACSIGGLVNMKNETMDLCVLTKRPFNRNQISLIKFHAYKITVTK
jgi:hypothetical protein